MFDDSRQRISVPTHPVTGLVVPERILWRTLRGLRQRSAGWRESACIWTGGLDGRVTDVAFHHELGDDRGTALSLELPEHAKYALYKRLASRGEALLALLHTHPKDWVDLSWIDQHNQVSSRVGFWSIVLPYYATGDWNLQSTGFHVRCERGWRRLPPVEVKANLIVERDGYGP
jgi:hypothetical protein